MISKLRTSQKGPGKISSPKRRKRNESKIVRMYRRSLNRAVEQKSKIAEAHPCQHLIPDLNLTVKSVVWAGRFVCYAVPINAIPSMYSCRTLRAEQNLTRKIETKASVAKPRRLPPKVPTDEAPRKTTRKNQSCPQFNKTSMLVVSKQQVLKCKLSMSIESYITTVFHSQPKPSLSKLQQKMCEKLSSAKFRWKSWTESI